MKGWTSLVFIAVAACNAGDDVADGTRGQCAEGGELNDNGCHANPTTAWDACWRMVDCGAIPLNQVMGGFDFDDCLEDIESRLDVAQRLVIACIGASTCDQLKITTGRCFRFGDEN